MTLRARGTIALCMCGGLALGQSRTILRAYAGADGRAHIVLRDRDEFVAAASGDEQQGVDGIQVSEDGRAAGWLVLSPNCCTSYPIPLELVVYRDGKVLRAVPLDVVRPVFQWRFWKGSNQVVLLFQNLHGAPQFQAELVDATTTRVLARWSQRENGGNPLAGLPAWAESFRSSMLRAL